jgi:hypothetical protein
MATSFLFTFLILAKEDRKSPQSIMVYKPRVGISALLPNPETEENAMCGDKSGK